MGMSERMAAVGLLLCFLIICAVENVPCVPF
jgi:hypothetical protein